MNTKEIDLVEFAQLLYIKRKFLLLMIGLFLCLGLLIAFGSGKEYLASTQLLAETSSASSSLGNLGGLAGLAGINLNLTGGGEGSLSPMLYPKICASHEYKRKIMHTPILFESYDSLVTAYTYFDQLYSAPLGSKIFGYTLGLPRKLLTLITGTSKYESTSLAQTTGGGILRISKKETAMMKMFDTRIQVSVDDKLGIIEVSAKMPDATAAATLAHAAMLLLKEKVTQYKISKATQKMNFISDRYQEAKKRFEDTQIKLAIFSDKNKNMNTATAKIEMQLLQNKYNIAFEVFKSLSSQLEQATIQVKEETPVFTALEGVSVPNERVGTSKIFILIFSMVLGFVIAVFFLMVKDSVVNFYTAVTSNLS